jgi:hypothetical protein
LRTVDDRQAGARRKTTLGDLKQALCERQVKSANGTARRSSPKDLKISTCFYQQKKQNEL